MSATPGTATTHRPSTHGATLMHAGEYVASDASWRARPRSPFCWGSSPASPKSRRACRRAPRTPHRPGRPVPLSSHRALLPRPCRRRTRRRAAAGLARGAHSAHPVRQAPGGTRRGREVHREQNDCLGGGGDRELTDEYLVGDEQFLTEAASTGRRLPRDELGSRRALGEQAAEAGRGLRLLVSEHLAAAQAIWARSPHPRIRPPPPSATRSTHSPRAANALSASLYGRRSRAPRIPRRPAPRPQRPGPPRRTRRALRATALPRPRGRRRPGRHLLRGGIR